MNSLQNKEAQSYIAALIAVLIWGMFPTLVKSTLQFASVEQLLVLRFLVASLLFLPMFNTVFNKLLVIEKRYLALFVIFTIAVFFSQTYVLSQVPASWYVAVFTLAPIIFLLVYRETLNLFGKIGVTLAIIGMGLFFTSMNDHTDMNFLTMILLIISMLSWVGYSIFARKLHSQLNDREIVALTSFVGFGSSFVFWGTKGFVWEDLSLSILGLCVLTGVVLPLALVLYSFSLRIKPIFAMFSQYLEPIFGLLAAALFLGEVMGAIQYLAAIVIIIGTLFVGISSRQKK
ncbi:DMT family transporter [Allofrancisella guangzhouensis]|uniref:EamA domain-containing protein n=1 Tax=Allofrancisella guangzhouensis TaxID=594679 RepID=A0A0A8E991_9GAMM|nr:DMT family transporter [Allofrancisella guangzhouensis]AJC48731.1 hypothetical protein SD28_03275 [Allofrancisella guangzhouensis]MBK2027390.1 DMT family transporter [Allofrancisella guangzhouensis]MBK2043666.1 DMT family transporter [Allofrancisella guangzhouensis]MBK2045194.1 DMT family transporter [Allofrancisella guangzhouensis]